MSENVKDVAFGLLAGTVVVGAIILIPLGISSVVVEHNKHVEKIETVGRTYEWHDVNSPFEGYVCKTNRVSGVDRGYESTVCIKEE
jgi:hypothetical protein